MQTRAGLQVPRRTRNETTRLEKLTAAPIKRNQIILVFSLKMCLINSLLYSYQFERTSWTYILKNQSSSQYCVCVFFSPPTYLKPNVIKANRGQFLSFFMCCLRLCVCVLCANLFYFLNFSVSSVCFLSQLIAWICSFSAGKRKKRKLWTSHYESADLFLFCFF